MKYRVSVGKLVDFACRSGDLVLLSPQGPGAVHGPSALQGIRAHQKIQQQKNPGIESEVVFKVPLTLAGDELVLSGRMDLLDPAADPPSIEEIKSTLVPARHIPVSASSVHWAQLKIYGYCYLLQLHTDEAQRDAASVQLGLLWYNLQDQTQTIERVVCSFAELQDFALAALERYLRWIKKIAGQFQATLYSAGKLEFPFGEFRPGQRDMAAATYRVARDAGYLMCEAPTGIGKTISSLFPALKAIGDGHIRKIVYLTAKTSGREVALKTVRELKAAGLEISFLVIQSKALVCHCSNGRCERDELGRCPLTLGFFDRLGAAREELMDSAAIDPALLDQVAGKHQVCPFELSLQILPWVNLVICDYNYVFDPLVRLSEFSEPDKRTMLLLDETHNLIDRARGMYSARLSRQQNLSVIKACAGGSAELLAALRNLNRVLGRWAKTGDAAEWSEPEAPATVIKAVSRCIEAMSADANNNITLPDGAFEWFKELYRYAVIDKLFGPRHRVLTRSQQEGGRRELELRLLCLNASEYLQQSFSLFRAVVAFSATLRPLEYYRFALGLPEHTQGMQLESPFDPQYLGVYVCPYIDTRYKKRDGSKKALVDLIFSVYNARRGNYLVFFPSYAYLENVLNEFRQSYPRIATAVQYRSSGAAEREDFLRQFDQQSAVLGFAIMGGIFGEGIDYQGDRLIGTIVVGTGLPTLGLEQQMIADDYASSGLNGFDYAYRYPGFSKVLQTAGRVIRSEQDKGVVVLADSRFAEAFYRRLYPDHWSVALCRTPEKLVAGLENFWIGDLPLIDSVLDRTEK